jgi:hypothetical protein
MSTPYFLWSTSRGTPIFRLLYSLVELGQNYRSCYSLMKTQFNYRPHAFLLPQLYCLGPGPGERSSPALPFDELQYFSFYVWWTAVFFSFLLRIYELHYFFFCVYTIFSFLCMLICNVELQYFLHYNILHHISIGNKKNILHYNKTYTKYHLGAY